MDGDGIGGDSGGERKDDASVVAQEPERSLYDGEQTVQPFDGTVHGGHHRLAESDGGLLQLFLVFLQAGFGGLVGDSELIDGTGTFLKGLAGDLLLCAHHIQVIRKDGQDIRQPHTVQREVFEQGCKV